MILGIPETLQTRSALQSALDRIWRLEQDLRYLLSLQRDGQRAFAKQHHTDTAGKRATARTTTHQAPAQMTKRRSTELV
jgi:hypothetical protein